MRRQLDPLLEVRDVWRAHSRLRRHISPTPMMASRATGRADDGGYWHKVESVLPTGSFKIRGALNALLSTPPDTELITASSGNHAAACAWAARRLERQITVVVPAGTPDSKTRTITRFGAQLHKAGELYDEAEQYARKMSRRQNLQYLSSFADRHVAAGGGTIALEILGQLEEVGTVVVPVGGGGLISGVGCTLKTLHPEVHVVGVQPEASAPMYHSVRAGRKVPVEHAPTLSDATAGGITEATLHMTTLYTDEIVTVTENETAAAIRHLAMREKLIAEGAGALATAAALAGHIPPRCPGPVVLLLSGANIDPHLLHRLLS